MNSLVLLALFRVAFGTMNGDGQNLTNEQKCSGPEPNPPQDPNIPAIKLIYSPKHVLTVCTQCPERSLVLCDDMYSWRQAFIVKDDYILSAYDQNLALTKFGILNDAGVTMEKFEDLCSQTWKFDHSHALLHSDGSYLDVNGKELIISADCDNIPWKQEHFIAKFYIQHMASEKVIGVNRSNNLDYLYMLSPSKENNLLWTYEEPTLLTANDTVKWMAGISGKRRPHDYPGRKVLYFILDNREINTDYLEVFRPDNTIEIIKEENIVLDVDDQNYLVGEPFHGRLSQQFRRVFV